MYFNNNYYNNKGHKNSGTLLHGGGGRTVLNYVKN